MGGVGGACSQSCASCVTMLVKFVIQMIIIYNYDHCKTEISL